MLDLNTTLSSGGGVDGGPALSDASALLDVSQVRAASRTAGSARASRACSVWFAGPSS